MTQTQKETATQAKLLATLKRTNPHKVKVFNGDTDDEPRVIAVPTRRRKWSAVIANIEAKPWSRCEMVDRSGDVLGYADNDAGASDVEDIGMVAMPQAGQVLLAERMNAMCQRSAQLALAARESEVSAILNAQRGVMEMMSQAFAAQTNALLTLAEVREAAADARGEAAAAQLAGADKDQLSQLVEALPAIVQALPALKAMLNGGKAPS